MPIKLIYFNGRGFAEVPRYMLAIVGVDFEDFRYPLSMQGPGNYHRPEFDADKATDKFDVNMGRVPILEVDGIKIAQSASITRYIAKKYGFAGSDEGEEAQVDMYVEHVRDIRDAYFKIRYMPEGEEKKAATDKWFSSDLAEWLGKLEKSLVGQSEGFAVGSKLSAADISIYYFLTFVVDNKEATAAAYASLPRVKAIVAAVAAHEGVKAWEARRPNTPF